MNISKQGFQQNKDYWYSIFYAILIIFLIFCMVFEFYKRFKVGYNFDFNWFYKAAKAVSLGTDIYQTSPGYI
jgi:hypothetical protein